MEPFFTPDVIIARDGKRAIAVNEYGGQGTSFDPSAIAIRFDVRRDPAQRAERILALLDDLLPVDLANLRVSALEKLPDDMILAQVGAAAVGRALDADPVESWRSDRKVPRTYLSSRAFLTEIARATRATDADIERYIRAKLFWSWRFDLTVTVFQPFDALRLGVAIGSIDRVAMILDGEELRRTQYGSGAVTYQPLPKLLRSGTSALTVERGQTSISEVLGDLHAPRYAGVRHHLDAAVRFASADPADFPNSAKEAISAVEAIARVVTGQHERTLGELIAVLRRTNKLDGAVAKMLNGLWGYASNAPGVRHATATGAVIGENESRFVLQSSKAIVEFLLHLDREACIHTPSA